MRESGSGLSEPDGGPQRWVADAPKIAAEAVREGYSRVTENAPYIAGAARREAQALADILKQQIERQPYVAAAVAFAIGWLFGRRYRPF